ncbi:xylulokinase [Candidatus Sumerlaeota bacterium]|nr:xylulokinase [Candidatus Sumerlaeota bacterium]
MEQFFLGIDSGTQSTKALLVNECGETLGRGQCAHDMIEGLPPGYKEQHPQRWIEALIDSVHQAMAGACAQPEQIVAIGVSGQQHGFVPLDAAGEVIRPAKLWCDTSTAAQCETILARAGGLERCVALIGNGMPAGFTASKILWLKENESQNFARLHTVLLPHDYLNFWLTGERHMEWGDASGTALLDVRTREWRPELLAAIDDGLAGMLPPLTPSWEPCGTLRQEAAEALGLASGALVASGGGDNMMGAIGTGCVAPGRVTASLGTSGTIYACMDQPLVDPRGEIAAFCDSTGKWLPLLCTMNVTVATELMKELLALDTAALNERANAAPAGCDGLLLIPYFEGERTPNVPDGTGTLFGLNARTMTPAHFARAAMEGATLGMYYGFNRMKALGLAPTEVRLTGGGGKSPLWRQICADVFNVPVVCSIEPEGAALGGALQALWQYRRQQDPNASIESIAAACVQLDESTRCEPNPENAALYAALQKQHDALSLDLRQSFQRHKG